MKDFTGGVVCGTLLMGILGLTALSDIDNRANNSREYKQIFLEEINKKPTITKQDSIYFYQKNGLGKYMIYENPLDTTKSFEEHIRLLDVPYSEIKRIVKKKSEK